jgi:hypothetical protein
MDQLRSIEDAYIACYAERASTAYAYDHDLVPHEADEELATWVKWTKLERQRYRAALDMANQVVSQAP